MSRRLSPAMLLIAFHLSLFATVATAQQPAPAKLDPQTYDPYLGAYTLASGDLIVIGRTERRLYSHEPRTGRVRGLDALSPTTFVAGPSLLVYSPVEFQITFTKNAKGEVIGLVLRRPGAPDVSGHKARLYTEERVNFRNSGVTLAGTLLLPATPAPHPALVFLHGSGRQDRNGYLSLIRHAADHFARRGVACLIYDKRGAGASTGDGASASFDDLAGDGVAGMRLLQSRSEIDPRQIGMWGSSQAGWVMAQATTLAPDIRFVISVSAGGSGYTVAQQELYNVATEMHAAGHTAPEIDEVLATRKLLFAWVRDGARSAQYDQAIVKARGNTRIKDWLTPLSSEIDRARRDQWFLALDIDFDPVPAWERYSGAVLAIFGELDASTPVREVVPVMARALASRHNTDFTIKVFPKAHHLILEAETGSNAELERLKRYVPGYFDLMTDWLRSRTEAQQAR